MIQKKIQAGANKDFYDNHENLVIAEARRYEAEDGGWVVLRGKRKEIVKLLVDGGYPMDYQNSKGETPLIECLKGREDVRILQHLVVVMTGYFSCMY